MQPVTVHGLDHGVTDGHQLAATLITSAVAIAAVIATLMYCRRHRVAWPVAVLVSGGLTFLLEPMFDHLWGLWFFTGNQWTAITTYGISIPIWLPIVYVPYYGAWTVWLVNRWRRGATLNQVLLFYVGSVCLACAAEQFYIQGFGLYEYQDHQPFYIFGNYPLFVTFVNGVPPFLASIVLVRLQPKMPRWWALGLIPVVPACFAADSFGTGWLYLAARHSGDNPSSLVLHLLALLTVGLCFGTVLTAAKLANLAPQRERELAYA